MARDNLFQRTLATLGMSQTELGKLLFVSRRTMVRYSTGGGWRDAHTASKLARLVFPVDPGLASELAAVAHTTLDALGLTSPAPPEAAAPPPPPSPPPRAVDVVVCAAAEAADLSPRAMRAALHAAVRTARELHLTLEALEEALAPARNREEKTGG